MTGTGDPPGAGAPPRVSARVPVDLRIVASANTGRKGLRGKGKNEQNHKKFMQISAEPSATKALWMAPSGSVRNRSLPKLCNQELVRSTTQR